MEGEMREKRLEERKEKEISFVTKPEQSWYFHGNMTGLQLQQQEWTWKIQLKSGMEKHAFNSSNARRLWVPGWFVYTVQPVRARFIYTVQPVWGQFELYNETLSQKTK